MKFQKIGGIYISYDDVSKHSEANKEIEKWRFECVGVCSVSGGLFEGMRPSRFAFSSFRTYGGFSYNRDCDLIARVPNFIFSINKLPSKYVQDGLDTSDTRRWITDEGNEQARKVFDRFLWGISYIMLDVERHPEDDFIRFLLDHNIYDTPPCWLIIGRFSTEFYSERGRYSDFDPDWTFKR